jgi:hypothetical protein
VTKDLHPYVCIVDQCNDALELFASKHEWLTHTKTRHLMRWRCMQKAHSAPVVFEEEEHFKNHMRTVHTGRFREEQLPVIAESCSHPQELAFESCPFCDVTPSDIEGHVGDHLRDLALLSLPWPEDGLGDHDTLVGSSDDQNTYSVVVSSAVREWASEASDPQEVFDLDDTYQQISHLNIDEQGRAASFPYLQEIADQHTEITRSEQLKDPLLARISYGPKLAKMRLFVRIIGRFQVLRLNRAARRKTSKTQVFQSTTLETPPTTSRAHMLPTTYITQPGELSKVSRARLRDWLEYTENPFKVHTVPLSRKRRRNNVRQLQVQDGLFQERLAVQFEVQPRDEWESLRKYKKFTSKGYGIELFEKRN